MARQYFIPGSAGLTESSRRQYFVPGLIGLNEAGAANYSASWTESLTVADVEAAMMTAAGPLADAASASDSYIPLPRYSVGFVAGGYAAVEGIARQFFVPGGGGINLTARAKILPPVSVASSYAVAEGQSVADTTTSSGAFQANVADFAFVVDLPAAQPVYSAVYGDLTLGATQYGTVGQLPQAARSGGSSSQLAEIALGDTQYAGDGGAAFNPSYTAPAVMVQFGDQVVEAVTLADLLAALASSGAALLETTTNSDAINALAWFGDTLSEGETPTDAAPGGQGNLVATAEATATDATCATNQNAAALLGEQAAPGDGFGMITDQALPVREFTPTSDDQAALSAFLTQLAEQVHTGDGFRSVLDLPTPLVRIIKAKKLCPFTK